MRGRSQRGLTLIEVMITISILGLVTVLIYGAFNETARNKEAAESLADRYQELNLTVERMAREISMAYVSAHLNPDQSLQAMVPVFVGDDSGDDDRLNFTSFSHRRLYRNAHESDQNELSYFIADHPEDRQIKVLARREQSRVDNEAEEGGRIEILLSDVEGLDFEYLDPTTGEWQREWNTTQATGQIGRLPSQVRIRLTVPHPTVRNESLTIGTRTRISIVHAVNHSVYTQ